MKAKALENLGVPRGEAMRLAVRACARAAEAGMDRDTLRAAMQGVIANPAGYAADPIFDRLAAELLARKSGVAAGFVARPSPAPHRVWGTGLEAESVRQMQNACDLPVAVVGALMPDAHVGYGLPIGGVLATDNAVVPYAVGVDIACRMKLTVLDIPTDALNQPAVRDTLIGAIESETCFGIGGAFKRPRQHEVMDEDWSVSPVTQRHRDKAWRQLGSSGSGNHFVEWGTLTVLDGAAALPLPPGEYLALLSHSGSRGTGAAVCDHYSKLAMARHADLPKELRYLAWLDLDSPEGDEYWRAMNLMGRYAAANHACIHRHIARRLGAAVLLDIENHHNFAWKERHDAGDGRGERELIVHRKGATPAGAGVLGIIPGSMASPGFVVAGKGSAASLNSASHGAGRAMSRTRARESFVWGNVRRQIEAAGVQLLSAGIDEVPGVYKDIHTVMAAQQDLVSVLARFDPKIVKMAPEGERAED